MQSLGINIGSTSLKMVLAEEGIPVWSGALPHEGDFGAAARRLLSERDIPQGIPAGTFPSSRSFLAAAPKSPSWGVEALHTALPSSARTIFKLVEPMLIPNDCIQG